MSDEKLGRLPETEVEYDARPPPPYMPYSGSGDNTGTLQQSQKSSSSHQQQGEHTISKGSSRTWWRWPLRRVQVLSHQPLRQQVSTAAAAAAEKGRPVTIDISKVLPRWNGHNGMTCGQGAMLTKLPPPIVPPTLVRSYSLDVICCPPQPTSAPQGVVARWQQARLAFWSDNLPEILRAPPIPWRANLGDCCFADEVHFVYDPYPIPFFTHQPEPGKVKACCHHDKNAATLCGMSVSLGGLEYERSIKLALVRDRTDKCYWELTLTLTSRDGDWLASLSRADAAALVGFDSVIRVVGWINPERDSVKNSVMFYAKTLYQPWLEPSNLDSHGHGQPSYPPSPMGAAHDEEMRRLVDDTIEMLIRGGD
ncbi:hypothetical protein B0T25DRAFT_547458 [Lasiosphaeria hispida]|uniref:Uncharacterized protein n=1 Tax=Lasiosphaeria hispida TaxID=260671 RepID=A0AAJ0HE60_9PEZI|nr:hypothetical protein B0T25DRAFT_547458 [Lasiosphaeria hispida]